MPADSQTKTFVYTSRSTFTLLLFPLATNNSSDLCVTDKFIRQDTTEIVIPLRCIFKQGVETTYSSGWFPLRTQ